MKYLRNYLLVLTLMLSVFTFVGCGNNDNETTQLSQIQLTIIRVQQIT